MKASMVYTNYRYDLTGTGLKYLGERRLNGQYIEKFRTNEMSVCRSCEPENGNDRLVISFSPFDGGCPDETAVLEIAETLGLDRSIDYEIISKPSFLCEKELVTYIIQTIPLPRKEMFLTSEAILWLLTDVSKRGSTSGSAPMSTTLNTQSTLLNIRLKF